MSDPNNKDYYFPGKGRGATPHKESLDARLCAESAPLHGVFMRTP